MVLLDHLELSQVGGVSKAEVVGVEDQLSFRAGQERGNQRHENRNPHGIRYTIFRFRSPAVSDASRCTA